MPSSYQYILCYIRTAAIDECHGIQWFKLEFESRIRTKYVRYDGYVCIFNWNRKRSLSHHPCKCISTTKAKHERNLEPKPADLRKQAMPLQCLCDGDHLCAKFESSTTGGKAGNCWLLVNAALRDRCHATIQYDTEHNTTYIIMENIQHNTTCTII